MTDDEIVAELTKIKGIGRWTVEMILIFRLTRPDVFPAGDLGIVKAIQRAYDLRTHAGRKRLQKIAEPLASVPVGCVVVFVGESGEQVEVESQK